MEPPKTLVEIPYSPRPLQREIHNKLKRWNVLVCHRRFGKTVLCINQLLKDATQCQKPRPRFAYMAPLRNQAKQVAWDYMRHYAGVVPGTTFNEAELRCDLPNGARISLHGCDNPDALRGIYLDGVVLDEYGQMNPRVWQEVLIPALTDREGYAIFIGTPQGKNQFWKVWDDNQTNEDWYTQMWRASETEILPANELAKARDAMTEELYAQEFECSFEAAIVGS